MPDIDDDYGYSGRTAARGVAGDAMNARSAGN